MYRYLLIFKGQYLYIYKVSLLTQFKKRVKYITLCGNTSKHQKVIRIILTAIYFTIYPKFACVYLLHKIVYS